MTTTIDINNPLIGPIAAFVGARLQYRLPYINCQVKEGVPVSTIRVDQHKQKFGYARVYCDLADPDLVQAKWLRLGHTGDHAVDFRASCFKVDAWHYRRCYMEMLALVPQLQVEVASQADHWELLCDDVARLTADLAELAQPHPLVPDHDRLACLRDKYGVQTNDQLLAAVAQFYTDPTFKQLRSLER